MDFHGHMGQLVDVPQPRTIGRDRFGARGFERNDGAVMPRPELPDMKIDDLVMLALDGCAHFGRKILVVGQIVHENRSAVAQQSPRPAQDDEGAHDADHRVEPDPAIAAAREQGCDGKNGCQCIC